MVKLTLSPKAADDGSSYDAISRFTFWGAFSQDTAARANAAAARMIGIKRFIVFYGYLFA